MFGDVLSYCCQRGCIGRTNSAARQRRVGVGVCVGVCESVCVYVYVCMCECICMSIYVRLCVSVTVCVCICVDVYVRVCVREGRCRGGGGRVSPNEGAQGACLGCEPKTRRRSER